MSSTIRAFIAIALSPDLERELTRLQSELQKTDADVKWVEPGNIHLTLKFLGDVPAEILPRVIQTVSALASQSSPFTITLSDAGAFPNAQRPRTIWAGIKEDSGKLVALAGAIKNALIPLGIEQEEHDFSAHITLGRIRGLRAQSRLAKALPAITVTAGLSQTVGSMALLQSQLSSDGPTYTTLEEFPLSSSSS